MKHACAGKRRLDELRSAEGAAAYAYYSHWMRAQRHTVPSIETFGDSKLFSQFFSFAEHVKKVRLPNPYAFIDLMVKGGVQPALWRHDSAFHAYSQAYDAVVPPEQQFLDGLALLQAAAEDAGVPLAGVFDALTITELLNFIERRKLTHWLLLASNAFKTSYWKRPPEERALLTDALQMGAAMAAQKKNPALVQQLTIAAQEVGL